MGAYIRQQRKLADLSMRQVSAMVGISNPYLSQIERGLRAPSEAVAAGIATALGIDMDEFTGRAGEDERSEFLLALENARELTASQRDSLAEIYRSFVRANEREERPTAARTRAGDEDPGAPADEDGSGPPSPRDDGGDAADRGED